MNTRAAISYCLLAVSIVAVAWAVDELRKEVNAIKYTVDAHAERLAKPCDGCKEKRRAGNRANRAVDVAP